MTTPEGRGRKGEYQARFERYNDWEGVGSSW